MGRTYGEGRGIWGIVLFLTLCLAIDCGISRAQEPSTPQGASHTEGSQQNQAPNNQAPENPTPQNQASQSQNPQNQNPPDDAPAKKKDGSGNPAQAAEEKTRQVTLEAAGTTKRIGEEALIKARNWESSWLTGVYIPKGHAIAPPTREQRREIYLSQTLTTPGAYMKRMFQAGFDQARGTPSQWDDGWGGYGERFASREGQFISANTIAALGNAALKYEVRYDQCRCRGLAPRARHAIVRNFLTYNETGNWRPQVALYGGAFAGGVISTTWRPHPQDALVNGGLAMLGQAGYGALLNFFIEFAGDINHKLGARN